MSDVARKLAHHWGATASPDRGASPAALDEFERRYDVKLPHDMRKYLSHFDGLGTHWPNDQDARGFSFWRLAEIRPVNDELISRQAPPIAGLERYFVFADFLAWLWGYAIRLDPTTSTTNPVVVVGSERPIRIADSFTEFVDLYVTNSPLLFGQGGNPPPTVTA